MIEFAVGVVLLVWLVLAFAGARVRPWSCDRRRDEC